MGEEKSVLLTQEAFDTLKDELAHRQGQYREEITKRIAAARAEGDLSENGGYQAAREEQKSAERELGDVGISYSWITAAIPAGWSLDFSIALTFMALLVLSVHRRSEAGAALVAAVVVLPALVLPHKLGLLVAAAVGIAAGLWLRRFDRGAA